MQRHPSALLSSSEALVLRERTSESGLEPESISIGASLLCLGRHIYQRHVDRVHKSPILETQFWSGRRRNELDMTGPWVPSAYLAIRGSGPFGLCPLSPGYDPQTLGDGTPRGDSVSKGGVWTHHTTVSSTHGATDWALLFPTELLLSSVTWMEGGV